MNNSNEEISNTCEYIFLDHTNIVEQLNTTHTNIVFCSRCNKQFIPKENAKPGSASFYRCDDCLSIKSIANDFLYSCNIS
tara:strand:+ start:92 stop:331 length:240 start_codon:yes stop_codon:yes gene_type:complete